MAQELLEIQKLQFSDQPKAESMLLKFLIAQEGPRITSVKLNPKPESLNSLNGFVSFDDNSSFFFKTHTEENEKVGAYYDSAQLEQVGYPMVIPRQIRSKPGQQIAFYEIIPLPTLFDLLKGEEDRFFSEKTISPLASSLISGQENLDQRIFSIYQNTLEFTAADSASAAPIHQLFYHRIAVDGRLSLYYRNKRLALQNQSIDFETFVNLRWNINGIDYKETFAEIIQSAQQQLSPFQSTYTVVGHGDAHNGNVFVAQDNSEFLYFDPAFAGRHSPFLDLVKPVFHNVFARWMYFPEQVAEEFNLDFLIKNNRIYIEHNFIPSPIRDEILTSKIKFVLKPLTIHLRQLQILNLSWPALIRAALFCCPFLTVNLFADFKPKGILAERYPLKIKLLALAMSMEMGGTTAKGSTDISIRRDSLF